MSETFCAFRYLRAFSGSRNHLAADGTLRRRPSITSPGIESEPILKLHETLVSKHHPTRRQIMKRDTSKIRARVKQNAACFSERGDASPKAVGAMARRRGCSSPRDNQVLNAPIKSTCGASSGITSALV